MDWLLSLDKLDVTRCNGKGQDAFAVAKELGRSGMLTAATSSATGTHTVLGHSTSIKQMVYLDGVTHCACGFGCPVPQTQPQV